FFLSCPDFFLASMESPARLGAWERQSTSLLYPEHSIAFLSGPLTFTIWPSFAGSAQFVSGVNFPLLKSLICCRSCSRAQSPTQSLPAMLAFGPSQKENFPFLQHILYIALSGFFVPFKPDGSTKLTGLLKA